MYEYGYGRLEDELIDLLKSGAPDFPAAERLIRQGADVNAVGKADDENVLSQILEGYWWSQYDDFDSDECDDCEKEDCEGCNLKINKNPNLGQSMCEIIRFFLSHGFDVNKKDGCYGAQCLYALTLATHDEYIIEASKLLFDAGARNRTISYNSDETPWDFIGCEGSFQDTCAKEHSSGNIYEAVYQMYLAIEEGRPYDGIDYYEKAVGKKILKVIAVSDDDKPIFYDMDLPYFKKNNCFNSKLYFVYEDGVLITTEYADFWVDSKVSLDGGVDVSEHFPGIVGGTVKQFSFDSRDIVDGTTYYTQPITTIEMESGRKVSFSINFGEVNDDERAAFFVLK
ncbi:MAG: hypothetical protein IKJ17_05025 [Clostridia bacterium]|nr:hypothetical protein [Clostridia bacterium]